MIERSLSMLLRVTMLMKDSYHLEAKGPEKLLDNDYTGNHIVLFECELKTPPSLALIDFDTEEFIHLHRLNFKNWKIVDVDHYIKGNSYFNKLVSEEEWYKDYSNVM